MNKLVVSLDDANNPKKVFIKIGSTPAGMKGEEGGGAYVTNVLGQSTTLAASQKLLTDNLFETNQKALLESLTEASDILSFTEILDEALR